MPSKASIQALHDALSRKPMLDSEEAYMLRQASKALKLDTKMQHVTFDALREREPGTPIPWRDGDAPEAPKYDAHWKAVRADRKRRGKRNGAKGTYRRNGRKTR